MLIMNKKLNEAADILHKKSVHQGALLLELLVSTIREQAQLPTGTELVVAAFGTSCFIKLKEQAHTIRKTFFSYDAFSDNFNYSADLRDTVPEILDLTISEALDVLMVLVYEELIDEEISRSIEYEALGHFQYLANKYGFHSDVYNYGLWWQLKDLLSKEQLQELIDYVKENVDEIPKAVYETLIKLYDKEDSV